MDFLTDQLNGWMRESLSEAVLDNFNNMLDSINTQVGDITTNVGQSPQNWNADIFSMIRTLSDTVILPVAGIILTLVMCYELIQLIVEKNNMHNVDTFELYKWIVKTFCAVTILSHTFDIVIGIFELAQHVVDSSAGVISGSLEVSLVLADLEAQMQTMSIGGLMGLWLETYIVRLCLSVMGVCIFIIIFGRMLEIYLTVSLAPIPLSTMGNREWGQMGNNYLKSLFALGFQGFLIMVCVAIYAVLVRSIPAGGNIHLMVWGVVGYTGLLSVALFRTSGLARSLFGAH